VPDSGFSGTDSVCVIVCDQTGLCDTTFIPVTVVEPLPPSIFPAPTPTVMGNVLCVEYTPDVGYTGDDEICVIICDQTGLCDTIDIPVSIIPMPEPPDSMQPPIITIPPVVIPSDTIGEVCAPIIDPNTQMIHIRLLFVNNLPMLLQRQR